MNTLKKPRELWISPLDIPSPNSFKVTGAIASGANPQNGEVLFREVIEGERPEVKALVEALEKVAFVSSAFSEPGRQTSYSDWELRTFARKALDEYRKARE